MVKNHWSKTSAFRLYHVHMNRLKTNKRRTGGKRDNKVLLLMLPQKFLLLKCAVKDLYCVSYLRFGREEQVAESEVKYPTPSHKGSEI